MKDLQELFENLHLNPKKLDNYVLALTHPSYNADANTKHMDYERLEFMGDAVLSYVCADLIFKIYPNMDQGLMSKTRSYLVKSKTLANYARKINLADYILTGHSIAIENINQSDKILEDVFEALIAAIYLDLGMARVYTYIKSFLYNDIKHIDMSILTDYKTKLQEEVQAEHRNSVVYKVVGEEGPAHNKTFTVSVSFNDVIIAYGKGKSKKEAEEDAAKKALEKGSM